MYLTIRNKIYVDLLESSFRKTFHKYQLNSKDFIVILNFNERAYQFNAEKEITILIATFEILAGYDSWIVGCRDFRSHGPRRSFPGGISFTAGDLIGREISFSRSNRVVRLL